MSSTAEPQGKRRSNGAINKLEPQDAPAHEWYRFVLSYPPHLVRAYLRRFALTSEQRVLDPFCGTGTTLVESKKNGIPSVGIEATPAAYLASKVKVDWSPDPDKLLEHAARIRDRAWQQLQADGVPDEAALLTPSEAVLRELPPETARLLLKNSISPRPLHKTLVLLECIEACRDDSYYDHERLALATALTGPIGNLQFGPEVGVGKPKPDAAVIAPWYLGVKRMAGDLRVLQGQNGTPALVHQADARDILDVLEPESIDAIITSPPYPNEKDYSRTTRLETVLLGYMRDRADLQRIKKGLVRSNTRGVYKADRDDDLIADHPEINRIAEEIEARRVELGKTSGFERLYPRVTKLYFGGMLRHLETLKAALRPGAHLAYVVGDQASYLRIMIRTGQILAELAESIGYECESIDLFRTRLATATRQQLREEVVVLRWPGK